MDEQTRELDLKVAELEQEARLMRARMDRLERENTCMAEQLTKLRGFAKDVMDEAARLCGGEGDAGVSEECDALSRWDGSASLDAVGYPLWLEFWRRLPVPADPFTPVSV